MPLKAKYSPLAKPSFANMYSTLTSLSPREQLIAMVVGGLAIVLLFILPLSVVSGKISSLKTGISKSQAKLQDVMAKVQQYDRLQDEIKQLERQYGRGVSSVTSTVESLTRKVRLAGAIEVLKEKPVTPGDRFTEVPVELRLKNTTLKALVELIYEIESYPNALLRIRNLQIKPRRAKRGFLEVSMDIANIKLRQPVEEGAS